MTDAPGMVQESQRLAADPSRSVWVDASAGTGKTKVLTDRVLRILLGGVPPHRLLCLTFTKAASAEMANRIHARLAGWSAADGVALAGDLAGLLGRPASDDEIRHARRLFARVLDAPGGLRIETIHAFCQSLLRRFPLEAGLAPHFSVMDERDSAEMLQESRDDVLRRAQAGMEPALADAVDRLALSLHEGAFSALLGDVAAARGRFIALERRFGSLGTAGDVLAQRLGVASDVEPVDIIHAGVADDAIDDVAELRAVADAMLRFGSESDGARGQIMADWLADPAGRAAAFAAWRGVFLTQKGEIRKSLCVKAVETAFPGAKAVMGAEAERLIGIEADLRTAATARASIALLTVAGALLDAYRRRKAVFAMLDYEDLIRTVRDLLEREGSAAWVLFKLDGGLDHILIDEAQDTNPDQWAVVRALSDEFFAGSGARAEGTRTLFAVGDPKQSIYSFQQADPAGFEEMRRLLAGRVPAAGGQWDEVALDLSFRSARAVLDAVDFVFNTADGRDGVIEPGRHLRHRAFRARAAGSVEIWPAVVPRPTDERDPWKPPVERQKADSPRGRLARLVAGRIRAMLNGEKLESKGRPIRPGDIMVLVRRRNAFVEELMRELKALRVPVAGADRMVLTAQMAVMDLMALGQALLLPEDDLTLATVLKGPLVGLSEEELFTLAWNRSGRLIGALHGRSGEEPFATAARRLERWAALAARLPPHEFYAGVLADGGKARLLARLGAEAEEPIDEFLSSTLAFERLHPPSLQGFLAWMEQGGVELKRNLDSGGDMVRIMTVHGAKGLQAPIIFLPDTLQAPTRTPTLLWLDEDGGAALPLWAPRVGDLGEAARRVREAAASARDREYRRLLYVAMTRAEDRLILCGWKTQQAEPAHCWYRLAKAALGGKAETVLDPFLAGRPEIESGTILRLSCPQEETVTPTISEKAQEQADALPDWALRAPVRESPTTRPLAPSHADGEEPAVRAPLVRDQSSGMSRLRRGRLIHRLLQSLPDIPESKRSVAAARFLSQPGWGLPRAEQLAIAIEVARVLDDPAWKILFGPGSRAEVPLVGRIGARIVSGQIDRLAVREDEVLLVDYKTNRSPPLDVAGVAPLYLRQLAAYRALLAAIYPGRRIRAAFLWTDEPRLMPVEGRLLDDLMASFAG
ncbi:MAG: double-strand break repair helicase AddA [Rhodospirillaceae bacterium]|nr:double-strand break repair helicase AddA [Rhodospirillaceae bacterium]